MPDIQDKSYFETKVSDDTKLSMSVRCDLRDLRNAAIVLEEIFGVNFTGESKSAIAASCVEALATMGYNQGYLDPDKMPNTTKQAARQLRLKYGITFKQNDQHMRRIAEAEQKEGLELSQREHQKDAQEKLEELERNQEKSDPEKRKQEIRKQAEKAGILDKADDATVEEVFHAVDHELPDPFSTLIQIGQNEEYSNQEIANILKPLVQRHERGDELEMQQFYTLKERFEEQEPQDPTDAVR